MSKNGRLKKSESVILFEDAPVRRAWIEKEEKWYFSVVDVIKILTESSSPNTYWRVLKKRLIDEGSNETVTKCNSLKMLAKDGKMRTVDTYDAEGLLRIIQSVPSKKAEPFKRWLARVGYERLQETVDPEISLNRARRNWLAMGHSDKWVEQRMRGQETRNKLTDYWKKSDVKEGVEYARLTDIIHREWSGLTTKQHKNLKGLREHNLRDNMTDAELIFTALAELSTTEVAKKDKSKGFWQNADSARKGGGVAQKAKNDFEEVTGKKVVSRDNFLPPRKIRKRLKK